MQVSDTDSWVDVQDTDSDDTTKKKLIYVDIREINLRYPQSHDLESVLLSQKCNNCNKKGAKFVDQDGQFYCGGHMQGLCVDYLENISMQIGNIMDTFISKLCVMLLYSNCPCPPQQKQQVEDLYAISKAELVEILVKYDRIRNAQNLNFPLTQITKDIKALQSHLQSFPSDPKFEEEVLKMAPEVKQAWMNEDNTSVCCFDVTHLFLQEEEKAEEDIHYEYPNYWIHILTLFNLLRSVNYRRLVGNTFYYVSNSRKYTKKVLFPFLVNNCYLSVREVKDKINQFRRDPENHRNGVKSLVAAWVNGYIGILKCSMCIVLCIFRATTKALFPQPSVMQIPALLCRWCVIIVVFVMIISMACIFRGSKSHFSPSEDIDDSQWMDRGQEQNNDQGYDHRVSTLKAENYRLRTELETNRDLKNYYEKKLSSYEDEERQHYKDLKFVKTEVEWLVEQAPTSKCGSGNCDDHHHKGKKGKHDKHDHRRITKADLEDLQRSINKALRNYQNYQ